MMTSTGEDLTARSAMTRPMAAGEPQKKPNGLPMGAPERHIEGCVCISGVGEFQVPCLADVQFSGVFLYIFQCDLHCPAHVRDIVPADDDEASVSAPALCVAGKLNGYDFRIGRFYCLVRRVDLPGGSGAGADQTQAFIVLFSDTSVPTGRHRCPG